MLNRADLAERVARPASENVPAREDSRRPGMEHLLNSVGAPNGANGPTTASAATGSNSLAHANATSAATAAGGNGSGDNDGLHLTNSDLNPNMEDVIKVLRDLGDDFPPVRGSGGGAEVEEHLNSVHEVAQLVDKQTLAADKLVQLKAQQQVLERRHRLLSQRLDLVRCRHLGTHVAEELARLREYAEAVVPSPAPAAAPRFDPLSLNAVMRPANVPDGVVLPSIPSTEVLTQPTVTTTSSSPIGGAVSVSSPGRRVPPIKEELVENARPEDLTADDKERADEMLGQMESNLKHMVQSYDSDATESSSGGESCDEAETYPEKNQDYLPIRRRAYWSWLANRANVASKWTWLTAQACASNIPRLIFVKDINFPPYFQISDLEYRIRQQTEFYRQIRAAKGGVTLGEPVVSWPPHARKPVQSQVRHDRDIPLNCKPVTKDYSRVDASGRKIIIKEPSSPPAGVTTPKSAVASPTNAVVPPNAASADSEDNSLGACRTRPVKMIRKRRILSTQGLYRTSSRAAKESSVRCDCIHPIFCCSICYGRLNHTQIPDPVTQERNQTMALLDHSYHQVLSTVEDAPLDILFMQKIKNRSWADPPGHGAGRSDEVVRKRLKRPKDDEEKNKQGSASGAAGEEGAVKKKKRLRVRPSKTKDGKKIRRDGLKRRRPVVTHHNDERGTAINDLSSDGDTMSGMEGNSPVHSPSVPTSSQAWADVIRRKRETAFDIDNIVIPYSIAAATRVERIKYKEILTPTWRQAASAAAESERLNSELQKSILADEDISNVAFENRHAKAEQEEKRRWALPLWNKTSGGQRTRNRRQDSCRTEASSGCNTPDPLSPGVVEKVDSLEVNTRPSTPVNTPSEENSNAAPGTGEKYSAPNSASSTPVAAGSIRNRRRTSSATKSRERNPSEDTQSSRCTTPTQEQQQQQYSSQDSEEVPPFEPRAFPLTENEYSSMVAEMPETEVVVAEGADGSKKKTEDKAGGAGGGAGPDGKRRGSVGGANAPHNNSNNSNFVPRGVGGGNVLSPGHSSEEEDAGEDTEEDPDWKCEVEEDQDDPEWSEERPGGGGGGGSSSASSQYNKGRKGHGLTLKIPPKKT